MTTYTVSAGQTSSGLTLSSGDVMNVLSGGSAVSISMTSGSTMVVSGGGVAVGATLEGSLFDTASTIPTISVLSGGITTGTVLGLENGQFDAAQLANEVVFAGGSAVDTVAQIDGTLVVSSGGSATATTLLLAGTEQVLTGGLDVGAAIDDGGIQSVAGSALGDTVSAPGGASQFAFQQVVSGGYASGTIVEGGGAAQSISNGGSAAATTVSDGGSATDAGALSGLVVGSGGVVSVTSGGTTTATTVQSGGTETVYGGGVASGTTVQSGGTENISSGGTTSDTVVNSGGSRNLYFEGTAVATMPAPGAFLYSALNVLVSSGVTSAGLNVGSTGVVAVFSGGIVENTVVSNGGQLFVSSGGEEIGTTLLGGAIATVNDGTDSGTTFSGAGPLSGSSVPLFSTETILSGGSAIGDEVGPGGRLVLSSSTASFTADGGPVAIAGGFGGDIEVVSGGATVSTTIGLNGEEQVEAGGSAIATIVSNGGVESVEGGTDSATNVSSGGLLSIANGSAFNATISSGGTLVAGNTFLAGGGAAVSATLLSGATGTVTGGTAIDTVVEGGASLSVAFAVGNGIFDGFTSDTTVESGATLSVGVLGYSNFDTIEAGGSAVIGGAGFVSGMAVSGTLAISGGFGSGIAVFGGGTMSLEGSFPGATATVVHGGGIEIIGATAADAGDIVLSGGVVSVQSGGSAGDTIMAGGFAGVQSGGVAVAPVLSGGFLAVSSGGAIQGPQVLVSGTYVASPGSVDFADVVGGTLVVGETGVLSGVTVSGFVIGDTIDLLGLSGAGSATVGAGNLLSVPIGGGQSIALQFDPAASFAGEAFSFGSATVSGQPAETITLFSTSAAVAPAQEALTTAGTIVFPNVRVGGTDLASVGVTNAAVAPAGTLSVVPGSSGAATVSGSITALPPGGTDSGDIVAGLNTGTAGVVSGTVTLPGTSTVGGTATPLGNAPTVSLSGDVFREAGGSVAPVSAILHVGDSGVLPLAVTNTAANDGFSEALIALIAGTPGSVTATSPGPSADILPDGTNASALAIDVPTSAAATFTGTVTVNLASDGGTGEGSIDGLGTTALAQAAVPLSVTVYNYANPVFEDVSGTGTFTPGGTAYTLNLGTIAQGTGAFIVDLGALNDTTGPSDVLTGSLSAIGSSAFTNSGLASIGTLAAGQADVTPEITLATGTTGLFSETITLTGTGSNSGGFSAALPAETLTVSGTVVPPLIAPAMADVLNGGSINFGNFHPGSPASETLNISNTASAGASALDASVGSVAGVASASGSFSGLAPGAENTTSITVGIDTGTAGVQSGTVALAFVSDGGTLGSVGLPTQDVALSGTVYREASAALLPLNAIVHVGAPGTISLPVGNSDPADGYSENLIAGLIGVTGGLGVAAAGPTADIAAGETNTLALSFSTVQAGTVSGSATVGLISDGAGIDGLGQTTLTAQVVPVDITVDNYATATVSSDGHLTVTGADSYVLNLGTATQGAAALSADLDVGNTATGTADWLNGSLSATGSSQFVNSALGPVSDITAGTSADAGSVSLSTSQTGVFSETIMLAPASANVDEAPDPQTAQSITVTGTIVAPTGTAQGDVHMVTFDGLHYDFQAIGDFVLTRSTVPGDMFQIQIETEADPSIAAVSITTQVAAQVGSDIVTFSVDPYNLVWVDGAPDTALNANDPVQDLYGGQLQELSPTEFRLTWATGEALTVTDQGPILNTAVSLPATDGADSVQGLLGGDSGQANDFQLASGRVIPQPLSGAEILGTFANAWRGDGLLAGVNPMQFIYTDGTSGQTVMQATAPGQILSGGPGVGVLSDAGGFGVTFAGTLAELAAETISEFSAKDAIDVTDLAVTSASISGDVLRLSDGMRSGAISLSGQISGDLHVTSDMSGGSRITIG